MSLFITEIEVQLKRNGYDEAAETICRYLTRDDISGEKMVALSAARDTLGKLGLSIEAAGFPFPQLDEVPLRVLIKSGDTQLGQADWVSDYVWVRAEEQISVNWFGDSEAAVKYTVAGDAAAVIMRLGEQHVTFLHHLVSAETPEVREITVLTKDVAALNAAIVFQDWED